VLLALLAACGAIHHALAPGAARGLRAHQERVLAAIG
jgi:hypothetical protein